jgi:glycine hydroxymethyltransferase
MAPVVNRLGRSRDGGARTLTPNAGQASGRGRLKESEPMSVAARTGLGWASIAEVDPDLWAAMVAERTRQHRKIELIASENYVFAAVMEAQGSWLTNKYAEGLPGRRYYGGCEYVDIAERLAQERALALFPGAEHVNVQPHSGAQANMVAYMSVLEPGDAFMGMNLAHGGHLSHGMKLNFSGRLYKVHPYGVRESDGRIDYDALERSANEVRPKLIVAGASAYPRIIDFERMAAIAHRVGALLMVDMAHIAGLVAAGVHPSPFPHADIVTTTTHKTLRGARGGMIFSRLELPPEVNAADFPAVKGTLAQSVDRNVFPGVQGGPLMHVIAGKAVGFKLAQSEDFRADMRRTVDNARILAEALVQLGARVMTGGTDTHLMLVDVTPLGVTGQEAEKLLDAVGITVNKNAIPFDSLPPNTASGIRVGTPAVTTRGFGPDEMRQIGTLIVRTIEGRAEPAVLAAVSAEVDAICARFPVPGLAAS